MGYARALEICATGRFVHAEEAERTGLANLVVPGDQLDATVADLAAALTAAPRDAVIETKALLAGAAGRTYEEQRRAERAAQARRLRDLAGVGSSPVPPFTCPSCPAALPPECPAGSAHQLRSTAVTSTATVETAGGVAATACRTAQATSSAR